MRFPKAREGTGLVIVRMSTDEVLVYDLGRHRAHCLNRSVAFIWEACDGNTTVKAIAARLAEVGLPNNIGIVEFALSQLKKARLLEEEGPAVHDIGRREALRRFALVAGVAAILPLVKSIVAPTVAMAASHPCIDDSACSPGNYGRQCCSSGKRCTPGGC